MMDEERLDSEDQFEMTVQDTNLEAQKAKSAAIRLGYFKDPFVKCFVKEEQKRDIIINRGYWARVIGVQNVQQRFLQKHNDGTDKVKRQIINLGCGYDTFPFILLESKETYAPFSYFEVDLVEVASKKAEVIKKSTQIKNTIELDGQPLVFSQSPLVRSSRYCLDKCDLTDIKGLHRVLENMGVDFELPTLIFAECVLAYIEKEYIESLLSYITKTFPHVAILDYDMVNPNDPFGAMMVKNFKLRNIPLKGMDFFNSFADIKNHYNQIACEVEIYNMKDIYYVHLNQEERKRIEKLEFLDELEEFFLMLQHYFMSLAKKSKITTAASPSLENTIISRLRLGV